MVSYDWLAFSLQQIRPGDAYLCILTMVLQSVTHEQIRMFYGEFKDYILYQ